MSKDYLVTIPQMRQVYYDTYANFPATGLKEGDLAYATDRKTLYRWKGAAWEAISIYSGAGIYGNIPTAANLPDGSMFYATDKFTVYMVDGGAWTSIAATDFPMKLKRVATRYVVPGWYSRQTLNQSVGSNLFLVPIFVSEDTSFTRIGVSVKVAETGKLARLGLYNWTDGIPSSLLLDAGTVSLAAIAWVEINITQNLTRGYYFTALVTDSTTAELEGLNTNEAIQTPVAGYETGGISPPRDCILVKTASSAYVASGLPDPCPATNAESTANSNFIRMREN